MKELNRQLDVSHVAQKDLSEKNQELENDHVMLTHQCDTMKEMVFTLNNQLDMKDARIVALREKLNQYEKLFVISPEQKKAAQLCKEIYSEILGDDAGKIMSDLSRDLDYVIFVEIDCRDLDSVIFGTQCCFFFSPPFFLYGLDSPPEEKLQGLRLENHHYEALQIISVFKPGGGAAADTRGPGGSPKSQLATCRRIGTLFLLGFVCFASRLPLMSSPLVQDEGELKGAAPKRNRRETRFLG